MKKKKKQKKKKWEKKKQYKNLFLYYYIYYSNQIASFVILGVGPAQSLSSEQLHQKLTTFFQLFSIVQLDFYS